MRDSQPHEAHAVLTNTWEVKSAGGLSLVQHIQLLEKGIHSVEKRACLTLSSVTILVVLDRVLQESKTKFPILGNVILSSNSLNFEQNHNIETEKQNDLIEALRFLLIELLTVLGRITADILTIPLHNELLKVTWTEPEKK